MKIERCLSGKRPSYWLLSLLKYKWKQLIGQSHEFSICEVLFWQWCFLWLFCHCRASLYALAGCCGGLWWVRGSGGAQWLPGGCVCPVWGGDGSVETSRPAHSPQAGPEWYKWGLHWNLKGETSSCILILWLYSYNNSPVTKSISYELTIIYQKYGYRQLPEIWSLLEIAVTQHSWNLVLNNCNDYIGWWVRLKISALSAAPSHSSNIAS